MNVLSVALGNVTALVCFTVLAIQFKNPWIVLISILFYRDYSENKKGGSQ